MNEKNAITEKNAPDWPTGIPNSSVDISEPYVRSISLYRASFSLTTHVDRAPMLLYPADKTSECAPQSASTSSSLS